MARKSLYDKNLVIDLYIKGLTIDEIAKKFSVNRETIRKCIQRNAPDEIHNRRNTLLQKIFLQYKNGDSFNKISSSLGMNISTIKSIVYKHIPEEVEKRRLERKQPKRLYFLSSEDIKILWERKRHMMYDNETMGTATFIKWNRQSYISARNGSLKFDKARGVATYGTPTSYRCKI